MRKTLNPTVLDNLTCPAGKRLDVFDGLTAGLSIRVTASKKTWSFTYTAPGTGKRARLSLGTYPATGLKVARERAEEARGKVENGQDPAEGAPPEDALKTFVALHDDRMALVCRGKHRRADETEWRFRKYIEPIIGLVAVQNFRVDPHYNDVVRPLINTGKLRMADVVFSDLRALLNYAVSTDIIERNRLAKMQRPAPYVPRERYLSLEEIKTVWHELPRAILKRKAEDTVTILRLCLVTGQRITEVTCMSRKELDLTNRTWTLPAARTKNGDAHIVPLSDLALELIREALLRTNSEYVFPNPDGTGPRGITTVEENLRRCFRKRTPKSQRKLAMPAFTPHDLRRTMATQMSLEDNGLDIPEIHISHCLNHRTETKQTMTARVYNKNKYLPEKRAAMDKWGAFLSQLVNVQTGLRVVA